MEKTTIDKISDNASMIENTLDAWVSAMQWLRETGLNEPAGETEGSNIWTSDCFTAKWETSSTNDSSAHKGHYNTPQHSHNNATE